VKGGRGRGPSKDRKYLNCQVSDRTEMGKMSEKCDSYRQAQEKQSREEKRGVCSTAASRRAIFWEYLKRSQL